MTACFIVMPITTPDEFISRFSGDKSHFHHVLEHLFQPAVEKAGFKPISPVASGADLIHAEIVRQLESSELVLCDISSLNPNVFFELGIRTAVDKPIALVRDNFTSNIPFDTSIVNFHTYDASLAPWVLETEIETLAAHLVASSERSQGRNPLWRYFGLTTSGAFRPEESPIEAKLDLVMRQLRDITERATALDAAEKAGVQTASRTRSEIPLPNVESSKEAIRGLGRDWLEHQNSSDLRSLARLIGISNVRPPDDTGYVDAIWAEVDEGRHWVKRRIPPEGTEPPSDEDQAKGT